MKGKLGAAFVVMLMLLVPAAFAQSTGEVMVPVVLDSEEGAGPSSQEVGVGAATGVGVAFGAGAGDAGGADGASSETGAAEQGGADGAPAETSDASGSTGADAGAGSGLPDADELEPIPGTQRDVQLGEGEQPRSPDWESFFGTLQPADDFIALMNPATGEVFARKQLCTLTCQGDISAYLEPARQALDYVVARVADANNAKARAMEKVGRVENGHYAPSDEFVAALAGEILAEETLDAEQVIERISDELLRQKADAMANAILETEFTRAEQAYDDALRGLVFAEFYIRDLVRTCILDPEDPAVQLLLEDITKSYGMVIDMHKNTGQILSLPIEWDAGALEAAELQQRYEELKVEVATQLATEVAFAVIQPEVIAFKASVLLGKSAWTLAAAALGTKRIRAAEGLAKGADAAGDAGRLAGRVDDASDAARSGEQSVFRKPNAAESGKICGVEPVSEMHMADGNLQERLIPAGGDATPAVVEDPRVAEILKEPDMQEQIRKINERLAEGKGEGGIDEKTADELMEELKKIARIIAVSERKK